MDENQAFIRLAELIDQLPAMEQKAEQLSQAITARELSLLNQKALILTQEYNNYQAIYETAVCDVQAARDSGESEAEAAALGTARVYAELIAVRKAPKERAERGYREALEKSGYPVDTDLDKLALSDEDIDALTNEIEQFQQEYQLVFELCQGFEE